MCVHWPSDSTPRVRARKVHPMSDRLFKQPGSPYWYGWYYDVQGHRHKVSLKTTSKTTARARLRQREQLADDPSKNEATGRLDDALDYFIDVALAGRSAGTRDSYSKKARHIRRLLGGDLRVGEIEVGIARVYVAERVEEGASLSSIAKELTVLRQTLKAQGIDPSFVPSVKVDYDPRLRYLTRAEFDLLCANVSERMRTFLHLTCLGGMRAGEAMAMRWDHVDWGAEALHVPRGKTVARTLPLQQIDKESGELVDTELREFLAVVAGNRVEDSAPIPLNAQLNPPATITSSVADQGRQHGERVQGRKKSAPLPTFITGQFSYHKELNRRAKQLGMRPVCANDLRRTFCSWMKQDGVDSMVVAEMMGHGSTRMIELVYGRLDMDSKRRAMASLPRRGKLVRVK